MFIIENKYGNNGYAVWFKLLETLGQSENHFIDLRNDEDYEFIVAKMQTPGHLFDEIVNTLSKIGAIHSELWENKIIWSWNFINNLQDVYKRRGSFCLQFNDLCQHLNIKCKQKYSSDGIPVNNYPQSKVKESIVKESTYSDFYDYELAIAREYYKKYPESKQDGIDYKDFLNWLFNKENYEKKDLLGKIIDSKKVNLLRMDQQLKFMDYVNLKIKSNAHGIKLRSLFEDMENYQDLKKNKSIYKTALNWMDRRNKTK